MSLLLCFCGQSNSYAGCFIGDEDYRAFHHGQFANQQNSFMAQVDNSHFTTLDLAWIYEEGSFRPIRNPFQPPCSGPNCKPNPFAPSLTPISSTSELPRVPSDSVISFTATPQSAESQDRFITSDELPSNRFVLEVNRPPEF